MTAGDVNTGPADASATPDPAAEAGTDYRPAGMLVKVEGRARQRALAEEGTSWREWLLTSFASIWTLLGFLTLDIWASVQWIGASGPAADGNSTWVGIGLTLVGLTYLEFLFWRFLYYRPSREDDTARRPFRRSLLLPVRFGVWTAEARRLRHGYDPFDVSR